MNLATLIVFLILAAMVAAAVRIIIKDKKSGKGCSGCSGGCGGSCGCCHMDSDQDRIKSIAENKN